jgi:predicted DsbA family dithiol-disulfide isomerase
MSTYQPVRIDVVSDIVCPWCFIGKHRLEKAIALNPDIPVEVHWRPYFLNDWIPREGISREQYLTTKFGSSERYKGIAQRVSAAAAAEGLTYAMDKISRQPNTLDAHRLIRWADEIGKAAEMKQRLMDLYFTEGADLTSHTVLAQAAADIGLDAEATRKALASDKDVAEIEREALSAKEAGIDGVPCFIFGGSSLFPVRRRRKISLKRSSAWLRPLTPPNRSRTTMKITAAGTSVLAPSPLNNDLAIREPTNCWSRSLPRHSATDRTGVTPLSDKFRKCSVMRAPVSSARSACSVGFRPGDHA